MVEKQSILLALFVLGISSVSAQGISDKASDVDEICYTLGFVDYRADSL